MCNSQLSMGLLSRERQWIIGNTWVLCFCIGPWEVRKEKYKLYVLTSDGTIAFASFPCVHSLSCPVSTIRCLRSVRTWCRTRISSQTNHDSVLSKTESCDNNFLIVSLVVCRTIPINTSYNDVGHRHWMHVMSTKYLNWLNVEEC